MEAQEPLRQWVGGVSDPAKQAAAEIASLDDVSISGIEDADGNCDFSKALGEIEAIISRALLSAQRPYVEWIMNNAGHAIDCALTATGYELISEDEARLYCNCGLSKLRDELRNQVGGE